MADETKAGDGAAFVTPGGDQPRVAPTTHALFVRVQVRPGAGQLELKRRPLALTYTWSDVFALIVSEGKHAGKMGDLNTVSIRLPGIGEAEVEITETVQDAVADGADLVTLVAHQPGIERDAPRVVALLPSIRVKVPTFVHAGQPKVSKCYDGLFKLVSQEVQLGFLDAEGEGLTWMKELNLLVFHTSPFHDAFKARGMPLPASFSFARNVKICDGQKAPRMDVDHIASSASKLATLLLAPHMMVEPWASSQFKIELIALHTALNRVAADMRTRVERESGRNQRLSQMFAPRPSEPMSSFKTLDATDHVLCEYAEVDGYLRALPMGVPLSTETFEPEDHNTRFRWVNNMKLSKTCYLLNFSVGGQIGTLHWVVILDEGLKGDELLNELNAQRRRLKERVPVVHANIVKRNVMKRFRDANNNNQGSGYVFVQDHHRGRVSRG